MMDQAGLKRLGFQFINCICIFLCKEIGQYVTINLIIWHYVAVLVTSLMNLGFTLHSYNFGHYIDFLPQSHELLISLKTFVCFDLVSSNGSTPCVAASICYASSIFSSSRKGKVKMKNRGVQKYRHCVTMIELSVQRESASHLGLHYNSFLPLLFLSQTFSFLTLPNAFNLSDPSVLFTYKIILPLV